MRSKVLLPSFLSLKFLAAASFLAVAIAFTSGCASDRPQPASVPCADCGQIVAIEPASRGALPLRGDKQRAASGARVLTPSPMMTPELGPMLGDMRLLGAGGESVPVYRLRDSGALTRRAEITLEMDDGSSQRLLVEDAQFLRVGDRVRRVGNRLMPEPDNSALSR